jgi:hypothetical protein
MRVLLFATGVAVVALMPAITSGQAARQQQVTPAKVNYWMDVSVGEMAGMPSMPFGMGGLMGGRGNAAFTNAQTSTPGKWVDLAVYNRDKPNAVRAEQAVPPAMGVGRSIPLIADKRTPEQRETSWEKPEFERFRINFYWGCGQTIRQGQPRVFEITPTGQIKFDDFMQGRAERDRGATSNRDASVWPNERNRRQVAENASLVGEHVVTGDVPASMRFTVPAEQDFMAPMRLRASGELSGPIQVSWNAVPRARSYMVTAMGMKDEGRVLTIWSAAEVPDSGGGLVGFLSPANVTRFLNEKAILPPNQTTCTIPRGVFNGMEMAFVNAAAHGPETNIVYPPRPADPRTPWVQEWTVRMRTKSQSMALVGMDMGAMAGAERGQEQGQPPPEQQRRPRASDILRGALPGIR